jgi:hypothetical protein
MFLNKKPWVVLIAVSVLLAASSGCTSHKILTTGVARDLAQTYLEGQTPKGDVGVLYTPLAQLVGPDIKADLTQGTYLLSSGEGVVHALLVAGFVKQTVLANSLYKYEFTPKFMDLTLPGGLVKIGRQRVTSVDNLLLDTETVASGKAKIHTEINDVARALGVKQDVDKEVHVGFQKQPDGNWVCVSLER